jgi:LPXTG-site transpeptidase (sortase) family protein
MRKIYSVAKTLLIVGWGMVALVGLTDVTLHATTGSGLVSDVRGAAEASSSVAVVDRNREVLDENEEVTFTSSVPARIVIPQIDVNAPVESVGINAKGNMAVPSVYTSVAWYKNGPRPGSSGNAVMAGHLDNSRGVPAVFARLGKLQQGDRIYVRDNENRTLTFVVTGSELYAYTDSPGDAVFTSVGDSQLVLITCEGEWDPVAKSYDRRRIVYAKLL